MDLRKKRPSHSVSLNSDISNSLGAVSVLNKPELAASANMPCASMVDLTNENSHLRGSSVNINFSLATRAPLTNRFIISSSKNEPLQKVASVYAKRARQNINYMRNNMHAAQAMRPDQQFVFLVCNEYASPQGNRPVYVNSTGRPLYRLDISIRSTAQLQMLGNSGGNAGPSSGRDYRYLAPYPCFRLFFRKSEIANPKIFWLKLFDLCFNLKPPTRDETFSYNEMVESLMLMPKDACIAKIHQFLFSWGHFCAPEMDCRHTKKWFDNYLDFAPCESMHEPPYHLFGN